MNIKDKHTKKVSLQPLFKGETDMVAAMQILAGELFPEHITKTPAMLLCVKGEVVFENEKAQKETLRSGDYLDIEPMVKHWVKGIENSQLVLMK